RINEIRAAKLFGEGPRRTFREAAVRHYREEEKRLIGKFGLTSSGVLQRKGQDQLNDTAWHLKMLDGFIGDTLLDEVCDDTLKPFVEQREQDGVSPKTIALSLEVVRRILNKAARKWRENKQPWLRVQPPEISMPKGKARAPFPLTRAEERALLSKLPRV